MQIEHLHPHADLRIYGRLLGRWQEIYTSSPARSSRMRISITRGKSCLPPLPWMSLCSAPASKQVVPSLEGQPSAATFSPAHIGAKDQEGLLSFRPGRRAVVSPPIPPKAITFRANNNPGHATRLVASTSQSCQGAYRAAAQGAAHSHRR